MKKKWIALFRGINVGGKNILPMVKLIKELETLKLENVRTYIQSGNVVFESDIKNMKSLAKAISVRIDEKHGFSPTVLIVSSQDLQLAIQSNPFPDAVSDPKSLHFYFLEMPPAAPNVVALDRLKSNTERYVIRSNLFYLHAPDGIGRSKLAASAERHLGVAATARNYRTVEKLAALAAL